jgi:hypothetical protein
MNRGLDPGACKSRAAVSLGKATLQHATAAGAGACNPQPGHVGKRRSPGARCP